jgi:hypothetical protein
MPIVYTRQPDYEPPYVEIQLNGVNFYECYAEKDLVVDWLHEDEEDCFSYSPEPLFGWFAILENNEIRWEEEEISAKKFQLKHKDMYSSCNQVELRKYLTDFILGPECPRDLYEFEILGKPLRRYFDPDYFWAEEFYARQPGLFPELFEELNLAPVLAVFSKH